MRQTISVQSVEQRAAIVCVENARAFIESEGWLAKPKRGGQRVGQGREQPAEEKSAYEQQRAETVAKNAAFLAGLGIERLRE